MDAYRQGRAAAYVLLSLFVAAACSDTTGVEDRVEDRIEGNLRLSVRVPAPGALGADFSVVPVTDDAGRTLDIEQVQLVFEEIELESVRDDGSGGSENTGDAAAMLWCWGDDDDDDCSRHREKWRDRKGRVFEAGPVLVDLPLDGGVIGLLEGEVPAGSYRELELEIDRPNDRKPSHQAFREEHPDWPRNASIRVRGTFDPGTGAQVFDMFLNVELDLELEFDEPLVIEEDTAGVTGPVEVTLSIDVNRWFVGRDGLLIDPRALSADYGLRERVARNIRLSFKAYWDRDHGRHGRKGRH
ncbi:MAG TPA: hypothetical protein VIL18_06220 [Longimicrobiales bacterium]